MYGLEAINAANGWAIAFAGALIVMSGLAVLSFVISQLHRVIHFIEARKRIEPVDTSSQVSLETEAHFALEHPLTDLEEAAQHYRKITLELGDRFELKDLYTLFHDSGFPHPHITIRSLRKDGFLVPAGESYFKWKD